MDVIIRPANPDDVEQIHALIRGLAVYDREPELFVAGPADLREAMFGDSPLLDALVAELDGRLVGVATF